MVSLKFKTSNILLLFFILPIVAIWDDMLPSDKNVPRPKTHLQKDYGQWCRNFTINQHVQCPEASPLHWYVCCGESGTECCFGIQTPMYVIIGGLLCVAIIVALYSFFLQIRISKKLKKTSTKSENHKYFSVKSPAV
uniref:CX domain-containing protein n=1 Tax=Rhabditophanes sp. KR3021 TaxID=114890 RepID=A0AC35U026_9BILA